MLIESIRKAHANRLSFVPTGGRQRKSANAAGFSAKHRSLLQPGAADAQRRL